MEEKRKTKWILMRKLSAATKTKNYKMPFTSQCVSIVKNFQNWKWLVANCRRQINPVKKHIKLKVFIKIK